MLHVDPGPSTTAVARAFGFRATMAVPFARNPPPETVSVATPSPPSVKTLL
jgi:hypothetical protein